MFFFAAITFSFHKAKGTKPLKTFSAIENLNFKQPIFTFKFFFFTFAPMQLPFSLTTRKKIYMRTTTKQRKGTGSTRFTHAISYCFGRIANWAKQINFSFLPPPTNIYLFSYYRQWNKIVIYYVAKSLH